MGSMKHGFSPNDHDPGRITYHSYLLRLWYDSRSGHCERRASLEDLETRERIGFATLEQLFVFLMEHEENPVSKSKK